MSNQGQEVTGVKIYGPHGDSPVWRCATIWGQSYVTARMMFGNNELNEYVLALVLADGGEVQVYGVYPAEELPERVAQEWLREVTAALPAALAGRLGGPAAREWRVINATRHLGLVSYLNRLGPNAELRVS